MFLFELNAQVYKLRSFLFFFFFFNPHPPPISSSPVGNLVVRRESVITITVDWYLWCVCMHYVIEPREFPQLSNYSLIENTALIHFLDACARCLLGTTSIMYFHVHAHSFYFWFLRLHHLSH